MTNPNHTPQGENEKKRLRDEVFFGLVDAIQHLGLYGEYARSNTLAFGTLSVEDEQLVIEENVALSQRPSHQDSGGVDIVTRKSTAAVTNTSTMRIWTPYEGGSSAHGIINTRPERIVNVWHERVNYFEDTNFSLITTESQRVFDHHFEHRLYETTPFVEITNELGVIYLEQFDSYIADAETKYPEVAERIKRKE